MKNIILVKLGGSIVTDKNTPKKADLGKINSFAREILLARKRTKDLIILGHGGGSFPHQSAFKFDTINGLKDKNSLMGMAQVKFDASELNMIILKSFINAGVPVFPIAPSVFLTTNNKAVTSFFTDSLLNLLKFNLVPLVYGDVITDSKLGSTIFSTEQIFKEIAHAISASKYTTKMIIQVGKTDGVYDKDGKTIPHINSSNYHKVINSLKGSESKDVTGGMLHKVTEAFELAKEGIPTLIISAKPGSLEKAILGKKVSGTWISY